jgi:SAM-dependent methyltransferase
MTNFIGDVATLEVDSSCVDLGSYVSYQDLHYSNDQHVSNKWTNYFEVYDEAFSKYIGNKPDVLEIGVQNGGGLQIAKEYFKNGNIYGIDINPEVCKMHLGDNIKTYCFNAVNKDDFDSNMGAIKFDTILDDGSHMNSDVIQTFKNLFERVKPGGVYVIEDLQTSYYDGIGFDGGYLKKDSSIEFLKGFVDLLNAYHVDGMVSRNGYVLPFIRDLSDSDRYIFEWLGSVTFHDGIAYVRKLSAAREYVHELSQSGKHCPIQCFN